MTAQQSVLAAFDNEEDLVAAIRTLRRLGLELDTYTPYPIAGMDELLGLRPSRVPVVVFCAGIISAAAAFLLQYWGLAINYPINVGGRPLDSWPAFMLMTFEFGVLGALSAGFVAYLCVTRLTTLYHPIFGAPGFERASQDRFLLRVTGRGLDEVRVLLGGIQPRRLAEITA